MKYYVDEHTSRLIQKNGLNEKIKLELKDYRDINKKFDSIISIEMFEAVGEKYWPVFFKKLRSNLKYNGNAIMQVITIADNLFENYKKRPDFIQRYIFPGGMLPSKEIFKKLIKKEGFLLKDEFSFASSYAKTLNVWNELTYLDGILFTVWLGILYYGKCWIDSKFK